MNEEIMTFMEYNNTAFIKHLFIISHKSSYQYFL
jgi:hypothetical protein